MSRDPVIYFRAWPADQLRSGLIWPAYSGVGGTDGVWAGMGIAASMGASTALIANIMVAELITQFSVKGRR